MGFPFVPLIAAAAQIGGSLLSSSKQNKQRDKEYQRQKEDSLERWNLQNEYNSPEQQYQRLKSAGLNPALLYGGGSGSQAAGQASPIQKTDLQPTQYRDPFESVPTAIAAYADTRVKQAQSNLMKAQQTKLDAETMETEVSTIGKGMQNLKTRQEVEEYLYNSSAKARAKERQYGAMQTKNQAEITRIKADIMAESYDIIKTMPEYEQKIAKAKLEGALNSNRLQEIMIRYQDMITNTAGPYGQIFIKALLGKL